MARWQLPPLQKNDPSTLNRQFQDLNVILAELEQLQSSMKGSSTAPVKLAGDLDMSGFRIKNQGAPREKGDGCNLHFHQSGDFLYSNQPEKFLTERRVQHLPALDENESATLGQVRVSVAQLQQVVVPNGRTLTFAGTAGEIAVTPTGAQDLSANRTWTFNLVSTAVTPATYGDATNVPQITIDQKGRITNAVNVPISFAGAVPTTRTLTFAGTANQVAVTPTGAQDLSADRSWTFSLVGPYTPATYTAHGILLGEGTSSIVATAVMTDGQLLVGQSAADPLPKTLSGSGATFTLSALGVLTVSAIANASLTNSSLTIAGTSNQIAVSGGGPVSLGGTATLSVPALAQLSVAKLTNLTTNGFVKTGSGDGSLSVDTNTYLTSSTGASSVSNADGSLTISPTTGAVVASIALGHTNAWTVTQSITATGTIFTQTLSGVGSFLTSDGGGSTDIQFNARALTGKNAWLSFTEASVADRWAVGIKHTDSALYFSSGTLPSVTDRMFLTAGGILTVTTGFEISGATTAGHYLRNDGAKYVDSALLSGDLPGGSIVNSITGTANQIAASASTGAVTLSVPALAQISVAKLTNLTTNGFVKTGSADGSLSIDTSTYLTGNQTITLSSEVTGSGTTAITTTIDKAITPIWTALHTFSTTSTTGSPQEVLRVQSFGSNAQNGPAIDFYIRDNTTLIQRKAAEITTALTDGTSNAISADLVLGTTHAGTFAQKLWLYSSGAMSLSVNSDTGVAGDFRTKRLWLRDQTTTSQDMVIVSNSSVALGAARTLTLDMENHDHTLKFGLSDSTVIFPDATSDTVAMLGIVNKFTVQQQIYETTSVPALIMNQSGNASPTAPPGTAVFWIVGLDGTAGTLCFDSYANLGGSNLIFRRAKGTIAGGILAVSSGLGIGGISFQGWDASIPGFSGTQGQFRGVTTEAWGAGAHGLAGEVLTTPIGSTTLTLRVRVGDGLMVGNTTDKGAGTGNFTGDIYTGTATFMHRTTAALNNGAGALVGTLTNSPATGNPTKWIPIDDNGTTRYIPAW